MENNEEPQVSLKEHILKMELENNAVYGFIDTGIASGKETFLDLLNMAKDQIKSALAVEKSLVKQTIELDGEEITLFEALKYIEFYSSLLDSSLKQQYPKLYSLAMEDYLSLNSLLELHLVTHTLEKRIKREKSKKKK